ALAAGGEREPRHPLPVLPRAHNLPRKLMARNQRVVVGAARSGNAVDVRTTHAGPAHPDQHLARPRGGVWHVLVTEIPWSMKNSGFHWHPTPSSRDSRWKSQTDWLRPSRLRAAPPGAPHLPERAVAAKMCNLILSVLHCSTKRVQLPSGECIFRPDRIARFFTRGNLGLPAPGHLQTSGLSV